MREFEKSVMRITPTRISTPPVPVSGFVTTISPTRIHTLPFTVSGIEQHTRRLINKCIIINCLNIYTKKTEKSVYCLKTMQSKKLWSKKYD